MRGWKHAFGLFQNRRCMWQMLRETLNGRYKMSLLTAIVSIASIAYIIFPFDLITDLIPVLGWIDDALVFFLLMKRLNFETQRYIRYKAIERRNP